MNYLTFTQWLSVISATAFFWFHTSLFSFTPKCTLRKRELHSIIFINKSLYLLDRSIRLRIQMGTSGFGLHTSLHKDFHIHCILYHCYIHFLQQNYNKMLLNYIFICIYHKLLNFSSLLRFHISHIPWHI